MSELPFVLFQTLSRLPAYPDELNTWEEVQILVHYASSQMYYRG